MNVYVLVVGVYDSADVEGVYATAEAAMEAHPKGEWRPRSAPGRWGNYVDGLDREDEAYVTEFEVQGSQPGRRYKH